MKNKKINLKTVTIIVLIGIIISLIFCILNMKNKTIEGQEIIKEQLSEATQNNAYISMENHLSEINQKQQELDNVQNTAGQATVTADKILKDYTAYKNGQLITGTMTNNGAWTNTPAGSGKVTIPAGYHNGSGYVDTTAVYNNGYNKGVEDANIGLVHGTKSGTIEGGMEFNVGYKPQYIYLRCSASTGTNTYYVLYIHIIPGYSDSVCFGYRTNNTYGASGTVSYMHKEMSISDYITLTDVGFIVSDKYDSYTYTVVY